MVKKRFRAKSLERAVRLVYSSLESHLLYTHRPSSEGVRFHIRCVKEYAEILKILSDLY